MFRRAFTLLFLIATSIYAAEIAKLGLSAEEQKRLERDKVLVVRESWRQIYSPYLEAGQPVFITSDSALAGFHALLEATVCDMEKIAAWRWRKHLRGMWSGLRKSAEAGAEGELRKAAVRHAEAVVGVALRLLGESLADCPEELRAGIEAATAAIEKGEGMIRPAFLVANDPGFAGLDGGLFRPRGFYAGRAALERYFRSMVWLQNVPFRVENELELTAFWVLAKGTGEPPKLPLKEWLGQAAEIDLEALAGDPSGIPDTVAGLRTRALAKLEVWARVPAGFQDAAAAKAPRPALSLRVVSGNQLPDATLFRYLDPPEETYGLSVAVALGSGFAKRALLPRLTPVQQKHLGAAAAIFAGEKSFYGEYLECLAVLFDAPDAAAPAIFTGETWQAKSCQTALGSWAWMRNISALEAQPNIVAFGISRIDAGFVEPDPDFFLKLAQLSERVLTELQVSDKTRLTTEEFQELLGTPGAKAEKLAPAEFNEALLRLLANPDAQMAGVVDALLSGAAQPNGAQGEKDGQPGKPAELDQKDAAAAKVIAALREAVQTKAPLDLLDGVGASLNSLVAKMDQPRLGKWTELARMCGDLEALAHKQLRHVEFSKRDRDFMTDYGQKLGELMLYKSGDPHVPPDDAPRVAALRGTAVREGLPAGTWSHAATGRPWTIYVLYPRQGKEVLCRGGVFSYYEPTDGKPMTDGEWKARLDTPKPPQPAEWTGVVVSPEAHVGKGER